METGLAKLEETRWHGPALVCALEPKVNLDPEDKAGRVSVYWVAHGSALVRVAPEHVRPEVPRQRYARLDTQPETAVTSSLSQTSASALTPVQGPVRFCDLGGPRRRERTALFDHPLVCWWHCPSTTTDSTSVRK